VGGRFWLYFHLLRGLTQGRQEPKTFRALTKNDCAIAPGAVDFTGSMDSGRGAGVPLHFASHLPGNHQEHHALVRPPGE
jgi:hypothetical protein